MNDLVIVGGGPAGLSAAVNAASEGLKVCLLEASSSLGGQAKHSSLIENYLGFPKGISGHDLALRAADQAAKFGTEIRMGSPVSRVLRTPEGFAVYAGNDVCEGRCVLVTAGLRWRRLNAPGIDSCGVHYGAIPQTARQFHGQRVAVIGAANSAGQAAMNFAKHARHVTLIARGASLRSMSHYLVDRIANQRNIDVVFNSEVQEVVGNGAVKKIVITNGSINADAVFIFVGSEPDTKWISDVCDCDGGGFINTDGDHCTRTLGVFAAGDIRSGSIKRVAAAVGEAARAIPYIHKFLAGQLARREGVA